MKIKIESILISHNISKIQTKTNSINLISKLIFGKNSENIIPFKND